MNSRICKICKKEKPLDDFANAGTIKGKNYKRWKCKKCYYKFKFNKRKYRRLWFYDLKKTLKCEKCGEDHIGCLEFHHRDPNEKELHLSDMANRGYSKEKILNEIKKCQVLCANCHRKLHWKEDNFLPS